MKLMVDLGNSCLKWATLEGGILSSQQRIGHDYGNLNPLLKPLWQGLPVPEEVWVANVAGPQKGETLVRWINALWGGVQPILVETTSQRGGVTNGYKNYQQLGVDRWLALIGAHAFVPGMKCIVDCGTAITLDVLSTDGQHLGGLIMPGLTTMQEILKAHTYALEVLSQEVPPLTSLAQDTQAGVVLGGLYAVIGWIEYVIKRIETVELIKLILTGGSAPMLLSLVQKPYYHLPNLVIQGLAVIANEHL